MVLQKGAAQREIEELLGAREGLATPAFLDSMEIGGCRSTATPATYSSLSPSSPQLAGSASAETRKKEGEKSGSFHSGEEGVKEAHIAGQVGVGRSSTASRSTEILQ